MHCTALFKYNNMSSAYNKIRWCVLLIETGEIVGELLIDCANGSSERANSSGLRGQPCLDPLKIAKGGELVLPVSTTAVGICTALLSY